MSNAEYNDMMESLQFAGHKVKWYVHPLNRFSKRVGFNSRAIAAIVARERGHYVTPDFA